MNREIIFAEQEKKGVWCKSVGGKQFVIFEYKALLDFISETGKTFEYIAVTDRNEAVKFTS